ncbi:4-hydroxy-2-oxovalerate aldolase [Burkholderia glumae]|uniref:4-hydroxy-2-oxovalerate aldolase n=1 Tax=Burkholderia glumae TaxID=337 RepID=UPI0005C29BCD|nr:4-hydroxy-2-oxovalerate aldolase [Burkholderia glumae]
MRELVFYDVSLRDGNHAIRHSLTELQIEKYACLAERAGIDVLEVGHGNGLGASSLQLGISAVSDITMIAVARKQLSKTKLGIHVIPGFAHETQILSAIDAGVDVVRVAAHCTEANLTCRHLELVRGRGCQAYGVLMMSHMAAPAVLLSQARIMVESGATAITLMDSAGAYIPSDVKEKIGLLCANLSVPVGFHGHNNLGLAVANTVVAVENGAVVVDGSILGFGAGAGNTPIEVVAAVLSKMNYRFACNSDKLIDSAIEAQEFLVQKIPSIHPINLLTGLNGLFSGFEKPINSASALFKVDPKLVMKELGSQKIIAGQEDIIFSIAQRISKTQKLALSEI